MIVQLQKCLHQVAIDGGSWEKGSLYLESDDPLSREGFAGEPEEVEGIHAWRTAMRHLRKPGPKNNESSESSEDAGDEETTSKKKKKKKKPKKPANEEAAKQPFHLV